MELSRCSRAIVKSGSYLRPVPQGRLAHERGRELPVMPGVERGGVEDQDGDLRLEAPVVVLRLEWPAPCRIPPLGRDLQVLQNAHLIIHHTGEDLLLEELADPLRAREVLPDHPQV